MRLDKSHLSDSELISSIDGELPRKDEMRVQAHLNACWTCRTRRHELDSTIDNFIRVHQDRFEDRIPPSDGPRALLKARMAQVSAAETQDTMFAGWFHSKPWRVGWAAVAALLLSTCAVYLTFAARTGLHPETVVAVVKPNPNFTPGATVLLGSRELCRESNTKNKTVPVSLQRRILAEYGIHTRKVNAYEIDYLITPALGGADDIRNLWPQSRSATAWNATVKDALEDHLREMVCDGQIDLAVAQREMATDWVQAYRKYFHTEYPLQSAR